MLATVSICHCLCVDPRSAERHRNIKCMKEKEKNVSVEILLSGNTISIEETSQSKHFPSQWEGRVYNGFLDTNHRLVYGCAVQAA
jgi:hypothetical protein